MQLSEIIGKKAAGETLSKKEIHRFINGIIDWSASDAQIAGFAMAGALNDFNLEETAHLTQSILKTGLVLNWSSHGFKEPLTALYSALSVGNKLDLITTPLLCACGARVPFLGEWGMFHTGGILDKLESIRGYDTRPPLSHFRKVVEDIGCAVIGPVEELTPSERRFQPIRGLTATGTSAGLTVAAILSKHLASGIGSLTLNISTGTGALRSSRTEGKDLSELLLGTARSFNLPISIVFSDASTIFGRNVGPALEMLEVLHFLKTGYKNPYSRLLKMTTESVSEALLITGLAPDKDAALALIQKTLASGRPLHILGRMIEALGGPEDFIEYPEAYLPSATIRRPVFSKQEGYVASVNPYTIGLAATKIGAQASYKAARGDHGLGFEDIISVSKKVFPGDLLGIVHAHTEEDVLIAEQDLLKAVKIVDTPVPAPVVIQEIWRG